MIRLVGTVLLSTLLLSPLMASANTLISEPASCELQQADNPLSLNLELCQQLAKLGDAKAQYLLGDYWSTVSQENADLAIAANWYEQASAQGNAQAQWKLGQMYMQGQGVHKNLLQAYIILKMASVNGIDEALYQADEVAEQMDKRDLLLANQILGQVFQSYLAELKTLDSFE